MRIITRIIALLFLALVVFLLWPSPLDSVSWTPEPIPPLTGSFEKNNKLDAMERIYEGLCIGCGLCASMFQPQVTLDRVASGYLRPNPIDNRKEVYLHLL